MDDRTFDEQTARQWILTIERGANPVRERDLYPLLRAWVERAAPARILEVGCGQGDCSRTIDLTGRIYVGIDPSPFLIERARELYASEYRHFQLGNVYALPFADTQLDSVFSVMVWHLLSDIRKASHEMSRVLRSGGHFLIVTALSEWAEFYTNVKTDGRRLEGDIVREGGSIDHDVLHLPSLNEIVTSLNEANLEVTSAKLFRECRQGQGRELLISIQGTLSR